MNNVRPEIEKLLAAGLYIDSALLGKIYSKIKNRSKAMTTKRDLERCSFVANPQHPPQFLRLSVGIILFICFVFLSGCSDHAVDDVRSSTLITDEEAYFGNVKIEKAIEGVLKSPQWSSRVTEYDQQIVSVVGGMKSNGMIKDLKIEFHLDRDSGKVRLYDLVLDGESQDKLTTAMIISEMFSAKPLFQAIEAGNLRQVEQELYRDPDLTAQTGDEMSALFLATREGHEGIFRLLLEQGANPNRAGLGGRRPLHVAVINENQKLTSLLLEHEASPDVKDVSGRTPLMVAANTGQRGISELLLDAGATLDKTSDDGLTPLAIAFRKGHMGLAQKLIESGANPNISIDQTPLLIKAVQQEEKKLVSMMLEAGADVETADKNGNTALHLAAQRGAQELVEWLLAAEASPDITNEDGFQPLSLAVVNKHIEIAIYLIEHGANPNIIIEEKPLLMKAVSESEFDLVEAIVTNDGDVNATDVIGDTVLHLVVESGNLELTRKFVEAGAKFDKTNARGESPLSVAITQETYLIAEYLLKKGANPNVKSSTGRPMIVEAICVGRIDIVRQLIDSGAKLNVVDKYERTLLHHAVNRRDKELVKILINHGVNVAAKDAEGLTALVDAVKDGNEKMIDSLLEAGSDPLIEVAGAPLTFLALSGGHTRIVQTLLDAGVDIEARNGNGETLLHLSASKGDEMLVKFLLERNAKVDQRQHGERRMTPLHVAASSGQAEIARLLIEYGADVEAETPTGETVLALSYQSGNSILLKHLLEAGASANNESGQAALKNAILVRRQQGIDSELVALLIVRGADISVTDEHGRSLLDLAFRMDENLKDATLPRTRICLTNGAKPSVELTKVLIKYAANIMNTEFEIEKRMEIFESIDRNLAEQGREFSPFYMAINQAVANRLYTKGFKVQMLTLELIERWVDLGFSINVGDFSRPALDDHLVFYNAFREISIMYGYADRYLWLGWPEDQRNELAEQWQKTLTKVVNAAGVSERAKKYWEMTSGKQEEKLGLNKIIANAPVPK